MAPRSVTVLKFVGSISLGLLTGLSYTLSTIAVPTLLTLPSASNASVTFSHLATRALKDLRIWAGISTSSFLLAYTLSPRGSRHPYLLWTSVIVAGSGLTDWALGLERPTTTVAARMQRKREGKRKMEASYEVLGDSHSDGTSEGDEVDEEVNGEEIRTAMEGFKFNQSVRLALSGLAFAMSVVGIWGDGS